MSGPRGLAARAAVDRGLLIAGGDATSYHFRHALLRQAVLDELLPDERVALHNAIAATLTAQPALAVGIDRIAELARALGMPLRDASSALRCARRRGGASGAELRVRGRPGRRL